MPRYFLEVSYLGTNYSGFQVQDNARSVQGEIERCIQILEREVIGLTGSSRTDAGVHALQNFFHFDFHREVHPQFAYKMNALLPADIAVRNLYPVSDDQHSRFDATGRSYEYMLHRHKNPFLNDRSLFYPYRLDLDLMNKAAAFILTQKDFSAFAKTNSQAKNFLCRIEECRWEEIHEGLVLHIRSNRFLRGMVRLLAGSLLQLGRGKIGITDFEMFFKEGAKATLSLPAHGLFLAAVHYPDKFLCSPGADFSR